MKVDPARYDTEPYVESTGIYVRAQTPGGRWVDDKRGRWAVVKSYGVEIPQSALDKVTALVETGEPFTTSEIERVLINAGVPEYHQHYPVAMRAADRIVQAWRRSGEVQRICEHVWTHKAVT